VPINQAGLAILAAGPVPWQWGLAGVALATSVSQLAEHPRWHVPAALIFLLGFAGLTNWQGMRYTIVRARKVANTVQGSEWIAANVPPDGTIGYDGRIFDALAPGVHPRTLADVYKGMMFRTYPRGMVIVKSAEQLAEVDFLYSTLPPKPWTGNGGAIRLEQVWTNGAYVLYRVASGQAGRAPGGHSSPSVWPGGASLAARTETGCSREARPAGFAPAVLDRTPEYWRPVCEREGGYRYLAHCASGTSGIRL
jgi:hypothetical protein